MSFIKLPSGKFVNLDAIEHTTTLDPSGIRVDCIGNSNSDVYSLSLSGDDARFLAGFLDKMAEMTMANLSIYDPTPTREIPHDPEYYSVFVDEDVYQLNTRIGKIVNEIEYIKLHIDQAIADMLGQRLSRCLIHLREMGDYVTSRTQGRTPISIKPQPDTLRELAEAAQSNSDVYVVYDYSVAQHNFSGIPPTRVATFYTEQAAYDFVDNKNGYTYRVEPARQPEPPTSTLTLTPDGPEWSDEIADELGDADYDTPARAHYRRNGGELP